MHRFSALIWQLNFIKSIFFNIFKISNVELNKKAKPYAILKQVVKIFIKLRILFDVFYQNRFFVLDILLQDDISSHIADKSNVLCMNAKATNMYIQISFQSIHQISAHFSMFELFKIKLQNSMF